MPHLTRAVVGVADDVSATEKTSDTGTFLDNLISEHVAQYVDNALDGVALIRCQSSLTDTDVNLHLHLFQFDYDPGQQTGVTCRITPSKQTVPKSKSKTRGSDQTDPAATAAWVKRTRSAVICVSPA